MTEETRSDTCAHSQPDDQAVTRLAEPGLSYVVFTPDGGDIEVDLTAAPSSFQVEWHTVASGQIAKADPVTGGAKRELYPPFTGAAVLFLHRPTQP